MQEFLQIHPSDNVLVATVALEAGTELQLGAGQHLKVQEAIPQCHKIAIQPIAQSQLVRKYGQIIGRARRDIAAGQHVHSHNLNTQLSGAGILSYSYDGVARQQAAQQWAEVQQHYRSPGWQELAPTFQGYKRSVGHPSRGATGVRNEIWLLPMVQCVNKTAERIISEFLRYHPLPPNVDGIYHFPHPYGCSQLGDDLSNTRRMLQAMCQHPNAGGVLLLGLGCENNTFKLFCQDFDPAPLGPEHNEGRIHYLLTQDCEDEVVDGVQQLAALCHIAGQDQRSERSVAELKIGLKCGGSDGFSGLTANPLLGRFSDFLIAQGGTAVLSEVPEMFGAEQLLMNRAVDEGVFGAIVRLIDDFKAYFEAHGESVFENPSPGNKAGGISTLEDKSLGCVQKGGSALVQGVHVYAQRIEGSGLQLLCSPGNDGISSSAMAAAGCQIVLFTTGRGTPLGCFVPTLKISSNSELAQRKKNWIDFDAGQLLQSHNNQVLRDEILQSFVRLIQATASGQQTKNEEYGFRELTIFKSGVTL